jgi:hypothetical protein
MVRKEDVLALLKQHVCLTTSQIYAEIGDSYPLCRLKGYGEICSIRTAQGLFYYLSENQAKLPREIVEAEIKPVSRPEDKPVIPQTNMDEICPLEVQEGIKQLAQYGFNLFNDPDERHYKGRKRQNLKHYDRIMRRDRLRRQKLKQIEGGMLSTHILKDEPGKLV